MVLLFLDFYSGNTYGSSGLSDLIKVGVPIFASLAFIYIQRSLDKRKVNKGRFLKLRNLAINLKAIIPKCEKISEIINRYHEVVIKSPLNDHSLNISIETIPELSRILNTDKEEIFAGFIRLYKDDQEAAEDYRSLYNGVELIMELKDKIYKNYYDVSKKNYDAKLKFSNESQDLLYELFEFVGSLRISHLDGKRLELKPFVNRIHAILEKYIIEREKISEMINFRLNHFLNPVTIAFDEVVYSDDQFARFRAKLLQIKRDADLIGHESILMAVFIKNRSEQISQVSKHLLKISNQLNLVTAKVK